MALDNIPTLGPGAFNANLDKVLVYKNGGSEVACSLLTLTNSALNIAGVYVDAVNQRVGIGTNTPNTALDISASLTSIFTLRNGATNFITTRTSGIGGLDTGFRIWDNSNNYTLDLYGSGSYDHPQRHRFYIGGAGTGERFLIGSTTAATIKGSGSTSATTSLLVQNSAGTEAFRVRDDLRTIASGGLNAAKDGYTGFISDGIYNSFGYNTNTQENVVLRVSFGTGTSVNTLLKVDNTPNSTASGPTTKPLTVLANSSQTANLIELQNSSGVAQSAFTANGNLILGASSINSSAILQADSTTKGFLPPRLTTSQKNAIATPAAGLMVYDTDLNRPCFYSGSAWVTL